MKIDHKLPEMLDAVHQAATSTSLFIESHIKIRAIPVTAYLVGGGIDGGAGGGLDTFIHAQLRIKEGRTAEQKKRLSSVVIDAINTMNFPVKVTTVEVVDIDSSSYAKQSNG